MRRINLSFISIIVSVLIIAAIAVVVFVGVSDYAGGYQDTKTAQIEETVMGSVAQCYALEGAYPPDLNYLQQNYGLQLDTQTYTYHYDKFASNILPSVRVFYKHLPAGAAQEAGE